MFPDVYYVSGGYITGGSNGTNLDGQGLSDSGQGLCGAGIILEGNFTMNGGTLIGNVGSKHGGAMFIKGGTFVMNGGMITGNSSRFGGAVSVHSNHGSGTFTLNGGSIIRNASAGNSGAIHTNGAYAGRRYRKLSGRIPRRDICRGKISEEGLCRFAARGM